MRRPQTYLGHAREAVGMLGLAARYPLGVVEAGIRHGQPAGDHHDTPVLLVHGYGHNRSGWLALDRRLRRAGFTSVHTFNYNPIRYDIPALAARLRDRVELLRCVTGAERVHIAGHSLGGILLRWYVQELGGDEIVDTAITVASPHSGTHMARFAPGATAAQMVPGSPLIRRLRAGARPMPVRWVAYYSNLDLLVQPAVSAMIRDPALRATNVLVKDRGHVSILLSGRLARSITEQLEAAEGAHGMGSLTTLVPDHGGASRDPAQVGVEAGAEAAV